MSNISNSVSIKVFPALDGDCLLITYGECAKKHILVDCGYPSTYSQLLQEELLAIEKGGQCLEKLILTHIDSDHISGAIPLLANGVSNLQIKEVWHNSYRHLNRVNLGEVIEKNTVNKKLLADIVQRGYRNTEHKAGEYPISSKQGTTVGALILKGNYNWNTDFGGKAVSIDNRQYIKIDEFSAIYLLSPDNQKLHALKRYWIRELNKYDLSFKGSGNVNYDDAFEMLLSWEKESISKYESKISSQTIESLSIALPVTDKTVTNGSSIAFILEANSKRMLFLADAHPDIIMSSIQKYSAGKRIIFDFIKVAHHGSFSNISNELLKIVDSSIYVFSTNGSRHNHPDKETVASIISRDTAFTRKLYFNYVTKNSQFFNRLDWMRKYKYSIHYLNESNFTLKI